MQLHIYIFFFYPNISDLVPISFDQSRLVIAMVVTSRDHIFSFGRPVMIIETQTWSRTGRSRLVTVIETQTLINFHWFSFFLFSFNPSWANLKSICNILEQFVLLNSLRTVSRTRALKTRRNFILLCHFTEYTTRKMVLAGPE